MKHLFTILILTTWFGAKAQLVQYTIQSEIFGGDRTISIGLPTSYNEDDSLTKYSVAYVFDGQFKPYIDMVHSMMNYYSETGEGIPFIVVGIHTDNRWGEFAPISDENRSNKVDGADKLAAFLSKEVVPMLESGYKVNEYRLGIGHSLGGTFVINEITKEESFFDAVIAASPNLTMFNEQIVDQGHDFYIHHPDTRRFVYATVGDFGDMELDFNRSLLRLDSLLKNKVVNRSFWNCHELKGENHMTTFIPSFNSGYLALSRKLMLLDDELIQMADKGEITKSIMSFYEEMMKVLKQENLLTADRVVDHAFTLSQYKRYGSSVELYRFALEMLEGRELKSKEDKELMDKISSRLDYAVFSDFGIQAKEAGQMGKYELASKLYKDAFDMGLIRGTHIVRMESVPFLAQAGEIDLALKQLELLANKFELGGSSRFTEDPLCEPLHQNPKWQKYIDKLTENAALYR